MKASTFFILIASICAFVLVCPVLMSSLAEQTAELTASATVKAMSCANDIYKVEEDAVMVVGVQGSTMGWIIDNGVRRVIITKENLFGGAAVSERTLAGAKWVRLANPQDIGEWEIYKPIPPWKE